MRISTNNVQEFGVEFLAAGKAGKLQAQRDLIAGIVARGNATSARLTVACYYLTSREDFDTLPEHVTRPAMAGVRKLGFPDVAAFHAATVVAQSRRTGASKRLAQNLSVVKGEAVTTDDLWHAVKAARPAPAQEARREVIEGEAIA